MIVPSSHGFQARPRQSYSMNNLDIRPTGVRESRQAYQSGNLEPERFPGELVLRDLRAARSGQDAACILARYAVLRAWLVGSSHGAGWVSDVAVDEMFFTHARSGAHALLDGTPAGWAERPFLQHLLELAGTDPTAGQVDPGAAGPPATPPAPWDLLSRAMTLAEEAKHLHGALALGVAAWTAALHHRQFGAAAESAERVAGLLERRGDGNPARRWRRVAAGLASRAPRPGHPSG